MKTQVSGHSGLRPEVELRMMQEKAEETQRKKEKMFSELLEVMNRNGVMPVRRRETIIAFAKWLEGK